MTGKAGGMPPGGQIAPDKRVSRVVCSSGRFLRLAHSVSQISACSLKVMFVVASTNVCVELMPSCSSFSAAACPWRITELGQNHTFFRVLIRCQDAKGSRRSRAMPIAHEQISVLIDGRSIVEAYTKRRLPHDLVIRHPQVGVRAFRLGNSRRYSALVA
jgi:hypothetical protein